MTTKIAKNATGLISLKEPWRARLGVETVWPGSDSLHNATDGTVCHEVSGMDRAFRMNPFIEIDGILAPGFVHRATRLIQLLQSGERRFIREVILAGLQYATPKGPMLAGYGCRNDQTLVADINRYSKLTGVRRILRFSGSAPCRRCTRGHR